MVLSTTEGTSFQKIHQEILKEMQTRKFSKLGLDFDNVKSLACFYKYSPENFKLEKINVENNQQAISRDDIGGEKSITNALDLFTLRDELFALKLQGVTFNRNFSHLLFKIL